MVETSEDENIASKRTLEQEETCEAISASQDEYTLLQKTVFTITLLLCAFLALIAFFFFEIRTSLSIFVGSLFGILYFRLLARSIGKLGKSSKSVGKIQLVVPVILVLMVSRLSQLDLLPALLGFLLYKPSLIIQFLLEHFARSKS